VTVMISAVVMIVETVVFWNQRNARNFYRSHGEICHEILEIGLVVLCLSSDHLYSQTCPGNHDTDPDLD